MKVTIPIEGLVALGFVTVAAVAGWMYLPEPFESPFENEPDRPRIADLAEPDAEAVRGAVAAMMLLSALAGDGEELGFGREVAQVARYHLIVRPRGFRDDCSGFVSAVFTNSGVGMDGVVASLYDQAVVHEALHWREVPLVGDLVFFDNTNDRNHNGEWDDVNTHIAVVIDVEPDGTAVFAHSGTSRGRAVGRINVSRSGEAKDAGGNELNSWLRSPEPWDPPMSGYLTGELWAGFATVDPADDWLTDPPPPESWP